jgi:glucosylceramidase
MKLLKTTILCTFYTLYGTQISAQKAQWISSTEDVRWKTEKPVTLKSTPFTGADSQFVLTIDMDNPQQTMMGWGGCFNELGWDALQIVDKQTQSEILHNLFSKESGLNFTFCRTSLGANDYSHDWYSYNETDGDFEMKNFSIERDKEVLIPYIRAALAVNPQIKLWASPWSAPTWFKTNHHYANRSHQCNDLPKEKEVSLYQDQMIQDPRYLSAYALYFSKYLDAYKTEGIPVLMVMYQNEAFTFAQWPNCSWNPVSIARFNTEFLGPKLAETHPEVEIYCGTFNTKDMKVFETIMNYPNIEKYVKGFAFQWEGKDAIAKFHAQYPQMQVMQSESECGVGNFAWKDAEHTFSLMQHYISGGASRYTEWNMILADKGASTWCWNQNALIRILSDTKEVIYTPEYYVYKHVCSLVPDGSRYLPTTEKSNSLAFRTPEGKNVLIIRNSEEKPKEISVKIGKKYLNVTLQAKSFNTFIIESK